MRLIDADALGMALAEYNPAVDFPNYRNKNSSIDMITLMSTINELPTIDPVRHGRWELNFDDFTPANRCSECGYNKPEIAGTSVREPETYCPSCGARMDKEET